VYLRKIGKADNAVCPFCNLEDDSSDHSIERCPEWQSERDSLVEIIGPDLTLPGIIRGIIGNREGWIAFAKFADAVMFRKEEAERIKEAIADEIPEDPG